MTTPTPAAQGTCYKFRVKSADEAASIIRDRLGPRARVLSVRTVEASGLSRLWSSPSLEVVARVEADEERSDPQPAARQATETNEESFPKAEQMAAPTLPSLLRRAGVSDIAIGRLQSDPSWPEMLALPLHRALVEVGLRLKMQADVRSGGRALNRAAFLSTPGSGRTTALCKWLGVEVFKNGRSGRVVVAEFDRPNPVGSLPMFCEALGVPFGRFPAYSRPAGESGFVYFDMPAISLSDSAENAQIGDFLARERIDQRVLVLNLAYDHATLRAAYAAGRTLGATHVVFTHLDEVLQWGRIWEYLCDGGLEPLFLSTGPSLTGDCNEDVLGAVVRRTLASIGSASDGEDFPGESISATPATNGREAHA
jgi:flagellar biosynthesis protein FlhF